MDLCAEVAGVAMFLEYCLVLGFVVPLIMPLTGIAFLLHLAVFRRFVHNGLLLKMDSEPSLLYLCGSFLLGCALVIWFFWENDLHGKELVAAGVPTMMLAACCLQKAMPLSEAPWSWLVYGPRNTLLLRYLANRETATTVEIDELHSQGPGGEPSTLAVPSMGNGSAAEETKEDDTIDKVGPAEQDVHATDPPLGDSHNRVILV